MIIEEKDGDTRTGRQRWLSPHFYERLTWWTCDEMAASESSAQWKSDDFWVISVSVRHVEEVAPARNAITAFVNGLCSCIQTQASLWKTRQRSTRIITHTHTHTHTRRKKKKTGGNQTIAIGNRRRWWRGRRWRHLLPPINKSAGNNYPYLVRGGETSEENDPNRPPAALRISNRWRELQFKWNR